MQDQPRLQPGQPARLEQQRERPGRAGHGPFVTGQPQEPPCRQPRESVRRCVGIGLAYPGRVPVRLLTRVLHGGEGQDLRRVPGIGTKPARSWPARRRWSPGDLQRDLGIGRRVFSAIVFLAGCVAGASGGRRWSRRLGCGGGSPPSGRRGRRQFAAAVVLLGPRRRWPSLGLLVRSWARCWPVARRRSAGRPAAVGLAEWLVRGGRGSAPVAGLGSRSSVARRRSWRSARSVGRLAGWLGAATGLAGPRAVAGLGSAFVGGSAAFLAVGPLGRSAGAVAGAAGGVVRGWAAFLTAGILARPWPERSWLPWRGRPRWSLAGAFLATLAGASLAALAGAVLATLVGAVLAGAALVGGALVGRALAAAPWAVALFGGAVGGASAAASGAAFAAGAALPALVFLARLGSGPALFAVLSACVGLFRHVGSADGVLDRGRELGSSSHRPGVPTWPVPTLARPSWARTAATPSRTRTSPQPSSAHGGGDAFIGLGPRWRRLGRHRLEW